MKKSLRWVKYAFIGILTSIIILIIFGVVTALFPNSFFSRMSPPNIIDYIFLIITSIMLGTYISLYFYGKQKAYKKEDYTAMSGTLPSIFAFSCPLCNVFLVSLLGVTAILAFVEPLRPILGLLGVGILGCALYLKVQSIKSCHDCSKNIKRKI